LNFQESLLFFVFNSISNTESTTRSPGSQSSKDFEATNTSGSDIGRPSSNVSEIECEEIDEIDTNNMSVYSGSKKYDSQDELIVPSAGKSLLLPSNNVEENNDQQLDVDLMLNVLNDPSVEDVAAAGTSSNNKLEETSQVSSISSRFHAQQMYQ
jgi:hypothetical protein